jgi:hypothetical protein
MVVTQAVTAVWILHVCHRWVHAQLSSSAEGIVGASTSLSLERGL